MGDPTGGYGEQGNELLAFPPKVYVDPSGYASFEKKSVEAVDDFGHGCPTNDELTGREESVKWVAFWEQPHCSICNTFKTDHITDFCPFLALASTDQTAGSSVTDLSDAERRIADLETRLKLNLVRVNNILDDTYESKFFQRFKRFGKVTHVYVHNGGNGFVNFAEKGRANIAIEKLSGSKFEDFTLQLQWANERPKLCCAVIVQARCYIAIKLRDEHLAYPHDMPTYHTKQAGVFCYTKFC